MKAKFIPANTGSDSSNNIAVTNMLHTNSGKVCRDIPFVLILSTVVMKFIAY